MDRKIRTGAAVLLALGMWLAPLAGAASADVINKIVLRVNDRIATLYDYQQRRDEALRELANRDMDPAERRRVRDQVGALVFKDLYEELMLLSRADQLGVDIGDEQVEAALADMREGFGIATQEEFERAAAQSGLTMAQLRDQVRRNLRMRGVMEREVWSRVDVDEEDLRRYYNRNTEEFRTPEQVHLREVVVLEASVVDPAERERLARELQKELAGEAGVVAAVERYAAEGKTSNLNDLGWVSRGDLDPGLERAAWNLAPGAVSEPVAARGGLHVVQMIERRPSRVQAFSEVSEQIARQERNRVYQEEVAEYMAEIKAKSLIVAEPPAEAAGYERLLGTGAAEIPAADPAAAASDDTEAAPAPESATPDNDIPQTQPTDSTPPGTLPEPKPIDDTPPPGAG